MLTSFYVVTVTADIHGYEIAYALMTLNTHEKHFSRSTCAKVEKSADIADKVNELKNKLTSVIKKQCHGTIYRFRVKVIAI